MSHSIRINGRNIGIQHAPYIIAELSANHNGDINRALKIIEAAQIAGADAVKIQTYTPDTITINCDSDDFMIKGGLWHDRTLYDLYQEAHMPWDWHAPLFDYAKKIGITIFSSPFDSTAVDLLEELNVPAYKIASFEAIDIPLIKYVASTKKPLIISTGMANYEEIQEAISAAREAGCKDLAILHCVSGYPAPAEDYNLKTIPDMIEQFDVITGLSDHTIDNTTAIASIALGATIVEKHFTLDRSSGGPDDSFSLQPDELTDLCTASKTAWNAMGRVNYETKESEKNNLVFRRSIYFVKAIKKGDLISAADIRSIRPGFGLPPKVYTQLIGRKVTQDIKFGTPVSLDVLDNADLISE